MRGQPDHCSVLRQLPIFEAASSASQEAAEASSTSLTSLIGPTFMAPASMPSSALPSSFVAVEKDTERGALQLLGVQSLNGSETLRCVPCWQIPYIPRLQSKLAMFDW